MGASLQVPQDPVAEDQFLEEPDGAFHAAIADGHLQGAVARRTLAGRGSAVSILSAAEGHDSSLAKCRPCPNGIQLGKKKRRKTRVLAALEYMAKPSEPSAMRTLRGFARDVKQNPLVAFPRGRTDPEQP